MRAAQVAVIPGTCINSATVARFKSTRAAGLPIAASPANTASTANTADRRIIPPFCAELTRGGKKIHANPFDKPSRLSYAQVQMQIHLHHRHHHHHAMTMPADCYGLN